MRDFIDVQVRRKIGKFDKRVTQIRIYLEHIARKSSDPKRASVKVNAIIPGQKSIVVKSAAHDLYDAVVDAVDGVVRKVRKLKEKRINKQRVVID